MDEFPPLLPEPASVFAPPEPLLPTITSKLPEEGNANELE
jgi:hypothetical protein